MVGLSTVFRAVDKAPSRQNPPSAIKEESGKEPAPSRQSLAWPYPLAGTECSSTSVYQGVCRIFCNPS